MPQVSVGLQQTYGCEMPSAVTVRPSRDSLLPGASKPRGNDAFCGVIGNVGGREAEICCHEVRFLRPVEYTHQNVFAPRCKFAARPGPRWGAYSAPPDPLDGFARGERGNREWKGLGMERERKWGERTGIEGEEGKGNEM